MQTARIGDVEVLIETVRVPGSEQTSASSKAKDAMVDLFVESQLVIESMAREIGATLSKITDVAFHPDEMEIGVGLKFAASGHIIVSSASAEASLQVKFTYKNPMGRGAAAQTPDAN